MTEILDHNRHNTHIVSLFRESELPFEDYRYDSCYQLVW